MSIRDNGGGAFPIFSETHVEEYGMTLRDWFAGQALQGLLSANPVYQFDAPADALAYKIADAMLEARKK